MLKLYHGSCHCGAVKFECHVDLAEGIRKCNCTFCRKTRMLKVFAYNGRFRLVRGEELLLDYQAEPSSWPRGDVHHYFCGRCGVRAFSKGFLDFPPFDGDFHAVNAACLDDVSDEEMAAVPVVYEDGFHDAHDRAPAVTAHL